jgi:hypothetical protein
VFIERYEYLGVVVEIWFNTFYLRYFWTLGTSPDRFYGPCERFFTVQAAKSDVESELRLMKKEGSLCL